MGDYGEALKSFFFPWSEPARRANRAVWESQGDLEEAARRLAAEKRQATKKAAEGLLFKTGGNPMDYSQLYKEAGPRAWLKRHAGNWSGRPEKSKLGLGLLGGAALGVGGTKYLDSRKKKQASTTIFSRRRTR